MGKSSPNKIVEPKLIGRQKEINSLKNHFDNISKSSESLSGSHPG